VFTYQTKIFTLHINISGDQGITFDKCTPGFDVIPHEGGENLIGANGIVNTHLKQAPNARVHGGFPKLRGVHLTQAFVALATDATLSLRQQPTHGLSEISDRVAALITNGSIRNRAICDQPTRDCTLSYQTFEDHAFRGNFFSIHPWPTLSTPPYF
jgi:hypothetical protein